MKPGQVIIPVASASVAVLVGLGIGASIGPGEEEPETPTASTVETVTEYVTPSECAEALETAEELDSLNILRAWNYNLATTSLILSDRDTADGHLETVDGLTPDIETTRGEFETLTEGCTTAINE